MSIVSSTSTKGTEAVRKLREQKLRSGLPFMINVQELAGNQCYLELPNGSIELVTVAHAARDMAVIQKLSATEARQLRQRFHFTPIT